jgi:hypothetical protein
MMMLGEEYGCHMGQISWGMSDNLVGMQVCEGVLALVSPHCRIPELYRG